MSKISLEQWKETTLKNYLGKHPQPAEAVMHVMDYLRAHSTLRLTRLSYPQALKKSHDWTKALNKKNKNLKHSGSVEIVHTYESGFKMVRLVDQQAKDWEGKHMGHCVSSYKDSKGIYSLRNNQDIPFVTLEINRKEVKQIQGKFNRKVDDKYLAFIREFLERNKIDYSGNERFLNQLGFCILDSDTKALIDHCFTGLREIKLPQCKVYSAENLKRKPGVTVVPDTVEVRNVLFRISHEVNQRMLAAALIAVLPSPDVENSMFLLRHIAKRRLFQNYYGEANKLISRLCEDATQRKTTEYLQEVTELFKSDGWRYEEARRQMEQAFTGRNELLLEFFYTQGVTIFSDYYYQSDVKFIISEECTAKHLELLYKYCEKPVAYSHMIEQLLTKGNTKKAKDILINAPKLKFESSLLHRVMGNPELMSILQTRKDFFHENSEENYLKSGYHIVTLPVIEALVKAGWGVGMLKRTLDDNKTPEFLCVLKAMVENKSTIPNKKIEMLLGQALRNQYIEVASALLDLNPELSQEMKESVLQLREKALKLISLTDVILK